MAKRPVVRRGRKNPNAGIPEATEKRSAEPNVVVPSKAIINHAEPDVVASSKTEEVQIFPMSGAVDRTAEFETRMALDKKLDAILGKRDEEEEQQGASLPDAPLPIPDRKTKKKPAQEEGSGNLEYAQPEVTESGSVLFDAVLPKGQPLGAPRRNLTTAAGRKRVKEDAEKALLNEQATSVTETPEKDTYKKAHTISHKKTKEKKQDSSEAESVLQNQEQTSVSAETKTKEPTEKKSVSIYDLKKDREAEEARIQAEVERRVSRAETELEPQVIISPKAARRSRLTVLFVSIGIAALALISIFLGINYDRMNRTLAETNQELGFYKSLMNGEDVQATELGEIAGSSGMTGTLVKKEDDVRRVYLTFDDGPSEVTVEILDILATYGVKATFFVNGKEDERSSYIYNRIVDEGHTLAMHGYSHDFDSIYASVESFSEDMHKLRNLLYDKTGGRVWCKYYRFPGGSSTTTAKTDMKELAAYLEREGIYYYDWNVYGGDDIPAATMISNIKANATKYNNVMILLHDAADKNATAMALPGIIEYLQELDHTVLLPVTDDTVLVQHGMQ